MSPKGYVVDGLSFSKNGAASATNFIKHLTLSVFVSGITSSIAFAAEDKTYYAGRMDCGPDARSATIIVDNNNSFEFYYRTGTGSYKGVKLDASLEGVKEQGAPFKFTSQYYLKIVGVSGTRVEGTVMKDTSTPRDCAPLVLEKTITPLEGYQALLDAASREDYSIENAMEVYRRQENLLPDSLIPRMDRTSMPSTAVRSGNDYWQKYMRHNADRISAMPVTDEASARNIQEEMAAIFNPKFGGQNDYLVSNQRLRAIVYDVLESKTKEFSMAGYEMKPAIRYDSDTTLCEVVLDRNVRRGHNRNEVLIGLPYFAWTREITEDVINELRACDSRSGNRIADEISGHYQEYIIPSNQEFLVEIEEVKQAERARIAEEKRLQEERIAEEKRRVEQRIQLTKTKRADLKAVMPKMKALDLTKEIYLETMGWPVEVYVARGSVDDDVYETFKEYATLAESKRAPIREAVLEDLKNGLKVSDAELIDPEFSFEEFVRGTSCTSDIYNFEDGEYQDGAEAICRTFFGEAEKRQAKLLVEEEKRRIEEAKRLREKACNDFISDHGLKSSFTDADFNLNIVLNDEIVSKRNVKELLCQMNEVGDVNVEKLGWITTKGYKVTYTTSADSQEKAVEEVMRSMSETDDPATAIMGIFDIVVTMGTPKIPEASSVFELVENKDFGMWEVTTASHSVIGDLNGMSQSDKIQCAFTPLSYMCLASAR